MNISKVVIKLVIAFASLALMLSCSPLASSTGTLAGPSSANVTAQSTTTCALTINEPGTYTLHQDLYSEDCGIKINASNVNLNLNGYSVHGPHDLTKLSHGILSTAYSNVEVYNGTVTGFTIGVTNTGAQADSSDVHHNIVRNMIVTNSGWKGIIIGGYYSKALNNTISNTGGTTHRSDTNTWNFAIEVYGASCNINNNTVTNTFASANKAKYAPSEAVGIVFSHFNTLCTATNNIIYNNAPPTDKTTFGFWVEYYSMVTLTNNYVRQMHYSIMGPTFTILNNNDLDVPFATEMTDRINDPFYNYNK